MSHENVTIPSCVNAMSHVNATPRVNTTRGNATSCVVEI